jgi:hypothetical protein
MENIKNKLLRYIVIFFFSTSQMSSSGDKHTYVLYGESLIDRALHPTHKDDEPKECVLPPLDKTLFPKLAALQEKHPIILKYIPNK